MVAITYRVQLKDLIDGNFKFYINSKFRNKIFSELKEKYLDWYTVAKHLDTDKRNLFGIRRGFDYTKNKKHLHYISPKYIITICDALKINLESFEKQIIKIKLGSTGLESKIKLPLTVNIRNNPFKIRRALADYLFIKTYGKRIDFDYNKKFDNKAYKNHTINFGKKEMERLRLRGLNPLLKENNNIYKLEFRNPGTAKRITKIIPKEAIFNEIFAKEFGKWIGDRCGGPNKVGVGNKNWGFVIDFNRFLIDALNQPIKNIDFYLTCRKGFVPNKGVKRGITRIEYKTTQYGDYAYRVEASNKFIRDMIFNKFEEDIFNILYNSKKSVVYSFYAGLFEAEGSIIIDSKSVCLASFGLSIKRNIDNNRIVNLLKIVTNHIRILTKFGFNPRISRKIGNTRRSKTLKYDIMLLSSKGLRRQEFSYLKNTIVPYIKHKDKIRKLRLLKGD